MCTLRNPNRRVNARFQGVNHPLTRLIWTNACKCCRPRSTPETTIESQQHTKTLTHDFPMFGFA